MSSVKYNDSQLFVENDAGVLSPVRSEVDGTFVTEQLIYYRVRRGESYMVSQFWQAITNNDKGLLLIRPAAEMSVIFHFSATGQVVFRAFLNPTFSGAGVVLPNVNRNSAFLGSNSSAIFTEAPTITDNGTPIFTLLSPGDKDKSGSNTGALGAPLIVKAGDVFLVEIENTSGGTAKASLNVGWIEAS